MNILKDLTLITASFNTPAITKNMLLSFQDLHFGTDILVCENSNDNETKNILKEANINFIISDDKRHSPSINVLLKAIKTRYALLVDTDIIFLRSISDLFDTFKRENFITMGEVSVDSMRMYEPRIHPCFQLIDTHFLKQYNIKHFDEKRCQDRDPLPGIKNYDCGSSFLEDLRSKKAKIGNINGHGYYFYHYGDMSWSHQMFDPNILNRNDFNKGSHGFTHIYTNGLKKLEQYMIENKHFSDRKLMKKI